MINQAASERTYWSAQWVLPVSGAPIEWGFVAMESNRIQGVGRYQDLPPSLRVPAPRPGSLITPGLINAHVHLEQSFPTMIEKKPGTSFVDWLLAVIQATRASQRNELKRTRCESGVQESLRAGVTYLNDIASSTESLDAMDQAGVRGMVALEVFHPETNHVQIDFWLRQYEDFCAQWEGHPRLQTTLSPHSPYNVGASAWQALIEAIHPPLIHTHVAECADETHYLARESSEISRLHQQVLHRTFQPREGFSSPIQSLLTNGLLDHPSLLAHAIETTAKDRQALQEKPVGIAHCPRSNMALHGKTLDWTDWQELGIPIGLGTDGRLSTPNLDLREEARFAMQHHGWSAQQALKMLTLEGARALQMASQIGSLEVGKQADWVFWQANPTEAQAPEALVLDPRTRVQTVMIDGQIRYQEAYE